MRGNLDTLAIAGIACTLSGLVCACSGDRTAIALGFVHDRMLNSEADVLAAVRVVELILDADSGLGVPAAGRYGRWQATNTDGDADLELVTDLAVPASASFPPYRLLRGALASGPFDITARGRDGDDHVVAAGPPTQAEFGASSRSVDLSLDLLGLYRSPRVVASQPADGDVLNAAPARLSVTFSRVIDENTVSAGLSLVSEKDSPPPRPFPSRGRCRRRKFPNLESRADKAWRSCR